MAGKVGRPGGNHGTKRGEGKLTKEAKLALKDIVLDPTNIERIKSSLERLYDLGEDAKFLDLCRRYMEFFIPKQAAVTLTSDSKVSDFRSELAEMAEEES